MASGITAAPQVHGAGLVVSLIADIATFSVDGVTIGSRVACIENSEKYELTKSDEALDPGVVEAVAGYSDARWILVTGGGGSGTVESVTGDGVDNDDPDNPVMDLTDVIDVTMIQDDAVTAAKIGPDSETFCRAMGIPGPWHILADAGNVQDLTIPDLDISVDGGYDLQIFLTPDSSANYYVQPNALSTDLTRIFLGTNGTSTSQSAAGTDWLISDTGSATADRAFIEIRKGLGTDVSYWCRATRTPAPSATMYDIRGLWLGGVNLTSIRLHSDDADGWNTGQYRVLWRRANCIGL